MAMTQTMAGRGAGRKAGEPRLIAAAGHGKIGASSASSAGLLSIRVAA